MLNCNLQIWNAILKDPQKLPDDGRKSKVLSLLDLALLNFFKTKFALLRLQKKSKLYSFLDHPVPIPTQSNCGQKREKHSGCYGNHPVRAALPDVPGLIQKSNFSKSNSTGNGWKLSNFSSVFAAVGNAAVWAGQDFT